jgi:hypothetical protein
MVAILSGCRHRPLTRTSTVTVTRKADNEARRLTRDDKKVTFAPAAPGGVSTWSRGQAYGHADQRLAHRRSRRRVTAPVPRQMIIGPLRGLAGAAVAGA